MIKNSLQLVLIIALTFFLSWLVSSSLSHFLNITFKYKCSNKIAEEILNPNSLINQPFCKNKNKNIFFLKTHKTASSTLTNILNRIADNEDLVTAIPVDTWNSFKWPRQMTNETIDWNILAQPINYYGQKSANIVSNHARFNFSLVDKLIQKPRKLLSIVREPKSQLQSAFNYENIIVEKSQDPSKSELSSFELFIENPIHYLSEFSNKFPYRHYVMNMLNNGQLFDFGINVLNNKFQSKEAVIEKLTELDDLFDLVLITNKFDESMVLLRKEMCWSWLDVLYVKQLERLEDSNNMKHYDNEEFNIKLNSFVWADQLLYQHFDAIFTKKIAEYGSDFEKDLETFRKYKREVIHLCISGINIGSALAVKTKVKKYERKTIEHPKLNMFCQQLLANEPEMIFYFSKKQYSKYYWKSKMNNDKNK